MLRLLLLESALFQETAGLKPEQFSAPALAKIYGLLLRRHREGRSTQLAALAGELSPEEMNHLVSVMDQPESLAHSQQALRDYIEIIETEALKRSGTDQVDPLLAADANDVYSVISHQDNAVNLYTMYGGFLFLGVFLGLLFLLSTVLIIYYKQISEGYEDQRRYQIMQQVGMSPREVRSSIRSQVLLVFFLPLVTAGIHVVAAFPMLCKLLELFNLFDVRLFALCAAGTLLVFCATYALVYGLTTRTYSRIVGGQ